jgi:hypothetical protein
MLPPKHEPAEHEPAPPPGTAPVYRGPDRRRKPTARVSRYSLWGGRRRTGGRRPGENIGVFVDQYSTRVWLMMLWIALMNAGDTFFTLLHLQSGGVEINPIAAAMLSTGRSGFVCLKSLLISVPLIILCLHKNFPLARLGMWTAAGAYTVLFIYHLSLL